VYSTALYGIAASKDIIHIFTGKITQLTVHTTVYKIAQY